METPVARKKRKLYVPPSFQIVSVLITTVVLTLIIFFASHAVKILDVYAPVSVLTPKKLAEFGGMPAEVAVGLYVRDFPKFDMVHGEFIADVVVWFKFDPQLISLDRLSNFTFEKASILKRSEPVVRAVGKDLVARYDMRIQLNVLFDYQGFPFDDHRLNLVLSHYFLSPSEVTFTTRRSQFVINPEITTMGWRHVDWRTSAGYAQEILESRDVRQHLYYPRVAFSIDFERFGVRHIISIIIPLLLIYFISLFTFSLDPLASYASIVALSATAITALIAYRFVIETLSPSVGYFMVSDSIFLLFLVATCVIFMVNILGTRVGGFFKSIISTILHITVCVTFLALFAR